MKFSKNTSNIYQDTKRGRMEDREFLIWIHDRLQHVHGEKYNVDYMGKLRSIINEYCYLTETPNTMPDVNSIKPLLPEEK